MRACSFRGSTHRLVIHHRAGLELAFELVSDRAAMPGLDEPVRLALRPQAIGLLVGEGNE